MPILSRNRYHFKSKYADFPDPCRSLEEHMRFQNQDLPCAETFVIWQEFERLKLMICHLINGDHIIYVYPNGAYITKIDWLFNRRLALIDELKKRGVKLA